MKLASRLYPFIVSNSFQQKRLLSANEAAVALRPFYFAVHPDRFAREPHLQTSNEKALQTFNGYLNNLFPKPGIMQPPVQIEFAMKDKENRLKCIQIVLSGVDAERIVRHTLEKCELSTEHLPKSTRRKRNESQSDTISTETKPWTANGLDEIWQKLQENERLRRKSFYRTDLFNGIKKNKQLALQRIENNKRMAESINDEIEDIQRRTGVTQILWNINWEHSFMRRCLLNVQTMIKQSDSNTRETIIHALQGRKLNFGRGSYVCCDGSLQFGADDASGAWQKVCIESTVRRFDLRNLELLVERVTDVLGDAQLIVRPFVNVLLQIQYMQIFIARICSQPKAEKEALKLLLHKDQSVEIVNSHCELNLLEGCIQVPCNVDFHTLVHFLRANPFTKTSQIRRECFEQKLHLETLKGEMIKHLSLSGITWDVDLPFPLLLQCFGKLRRIDESHIIDFTNLELHISSSPKLMVLSTGKISVPVEWIQEL